MSELTDPPSPDRTAAPTSRRNAVGVVAIVAAAAGSVMACISATLIAGWALLALGFVLGVVGLFGSGKSKTPSIAAIVVSIIGAAAGLVVFTSLLSGAVA